MKLRIYVCNRDQPLINDSKNVKFVSLVEAVENGTIQDLLDWVEQDKDRLLLNVDNVHCIGCDRYANHNKNRQT